MEQQYRNTIFKEALKSFASPEQLFYNLKDGYFAYIPKNVSGERGKHYKQETH